MTSMTAEIGCPIYSMPSLRLFDPTGRVKVGQSFDGEVSAPTVSRDGRVVGVYLDDETPALGYWINKAVAKYGSWHLDGGPDGPMVIVGVSMSTPRLRHPGVLNAQEWYPFHSGFPLWEWGRLPPAHAYISQWSYPGFAGKRPPTYLQRRLLLAKIRHKRPALILCY